MNTKSFLNTSQHNSKEKFTHLTLPKKTKLYAIQKINPNTLYESYLTPEIERQLNDSGLTGGEAFAFGYILKDQFTEKCTIKSANDNEGIWFTHNAIIKATTVSYKTIQRAIDKVIDAFSITYTPGDFEWKQTTIEDLTINVRTKTASKIVLPPIFDIPWQAFIAYACKKKERYRDIIINDRANFQSKKIETHCRVTYPHFDQKQASKNTKTQNVHHTIINNVVIYKTSDNNEQINKDSSMFNNKISLDDILADPKGFADFVYKRCAYRKISSERTPIMPDVVEQFLKSEKCKVKGFCSYTALAKFVDGVITHSEKNKYDLNRRGISNKQEKARESVRKKRTDQNSGKSIIEVIKDVAGKFIARNPTFCPDKTDFNVSDNDNVAPALTSESKSINNVNILQEQCNKPKEWQDLCADIVSHLGYATYKSWFIDCDFEIIDVNHYRIITASKFKKAQIETNYEIHIREFFYKQTNINPYIEVIYGKKT